MSHLLQAIVALDPFALKSELQLPHRPGDEARDPINKHRDDDWDHLWTDVGGEA